MGEDRKLEGEEKGEFCHNDPEKRLWKLVVASGPPLVSRSPPIRLNAWKADIDGSERLNGDVFSKDDEDDDGTVPAASDANDDRLLGGTKSERFSIPGGAEDDEDEEEVGSRSEPQLKEDEGKAFHERSESDPRSIVAESERLDVKEGGAELKVFSGERWGGDPTERETLVALWGLRDVPEVMKGD